MNQKIYFAILFVAVCLCLTSAVPTYGGYSLGLGQQYPRTYGGFGINPYAGAYGSIGSTDPYINGFGSEYGSRYGSYSGPNYNRYGYGGIGSGYGGIGGGYGGVGGGYGGVGGFQY